MKREGAEYVLYWAQVNRRVDGNRALAFAIRLADELRLPVLFYEGIRFDYPHANDRLHTFLLEGASDNAAAARRAGLGYCLYVRRRAADPDNVLLRLAERAAAVVADDYPTFLSVRLNATVPRQVNVPYYVVDASCIVPWRVMTKREWAAYTIRPKIRRALPDWLKPVDPPRPGVRWHRPAPSWHTEVKSVADVVASSDIDHSVRPSAVFRGGTEAARSRLRMFLENRLRRYPDERNEPAAHATSNLSPYLHFGHISSLEVALAAQDYAAEHGIAADAFLEELIVRRELSFNFCHFEPRHDSLEALPDWARATLAKHARDKRNPTFTRDQMERGETYDDLWNATQKELLLRGKIHGYYRMYWGKKIIEWAPTHEEAFNAMIYFHDRYALDGRDPNTYTSVLWCFGLHDRPWAERPIFGQVRYMSYEGMKRKTDTAAYIREIEYLERTGKDVQTV